MVHFGLGKAKLIGAHAKELFSGPGFSGRVFAAVASATYLQMSDGEILWLAQNDVPMHPRALRGDFDLSALRVGMMFRSDGVCLQFDVGAQCVAPLRFTDARVWQPAMIDPARVAPREVVSTRAKKWCTAEQGNHPSTSFRAGSGLPLQDELARGCRDRDLKRVADAARALIGLGEGLTPSGDDFVGGLLFTAFHLRAAYPGAFRWEQRAIDDLLDWAQSRTNVISYALLRDHARGQSVAPLHDWLAALLTDRDASQLDECARRVIAIGHTTGHAMLAGALTGVSLANA